MPQPHSKSHWGIQIYPFVCFVKTDQTCSPINPNEYDGYGDIYLFSNLSRHWGEYDDICPQLYVVTSFDVIALAIDKV